MSSFPTIGIQFFYLELIIGDEFFSTITVNSLIVVMNNGRFHTKALQFLKNILQQFLLLKMELYCDSVELLMCHHEPIYL